MRNYIVTKGVLDGQNGKLEQKRRAFFVPSRPLASSSGGNQASILKPRCEGKKAVDVSSFILGNCPQDWFFELRMRSGSRYNSCSP